MLEESHLARGRAVFAFAARQLNRLVEQHPDYFPIYTVGGRWRHGGEAWTNWCEGFMGGQLWLVHLATQGPRWRQRAEHYSRLIEHRQFDRNVHDLGFLFWPTWKRWYDLTGDESRNTTVIQAGRTLAMRYNSRGRYLRSFVSAGSLFIDIMMNVGIIFYAAQQTGDAALLDIATQHCLTTQRFLVRGDGSTSHEGLFDLETGQFLRQTTHQGWRDDSSWARGLAWSLYGFGTAYRFTGDARFLATAEACANFYMARTQSHGVPPNDWEEPTPAYQHESSAAAIAAGGFWGLSQLVPDGERQAVYRSYALRILDTLSDTRFLASQTSGWEGVLLHGTYHQRKGLGLDESVMWGDYFFLETWARVLGLIDG